MIDLEMGIFGMDTGVEDMVDGKKAVGIQQRVQIDKRAYGGGHTVDDLGSFDNRAHRKEG